MKSLFAFIPKRIQARTVACFVLFLLGLTVLLFAVIANFSGSFNAGTLLAYVLAAVLLLFSLLARFLPKWIRIVFWILFALGISLIAFLLIYGNCDTVTYEEDVIIVLGAGLRGEAPSRTLKNRLDTAYEYHLKNPNAIILVSGGQGPDEIIPESLAMKRYLMEKGVPEEKIWEESASTSTIENLTFSKELIDAVFTDGYQAAFISDGYHIFRATQQAKHVGYKNITHTASPTYWSIALSSWLRECAAVFQFWLLKK